MLHPFMLLGLLGLAAPVVIHLIQRQRLRPQLLATLRFLDREDVANAFAPVPRDLLQLVLRCMVLALFALVMCRLVFPGGDVGPRTLAVVIDQSLSMQQRTDGVESAFDRAKARILELIDGLRPGDRMSLVAVGDDVTLDTGFLDDRAALRRHAESIAVTDGGGLALIPAIRSAVDGLAGRRAVNACVIVLSDSQRSNFDAALREMPEASPDRIPPASVAAAFRDRLEAGRVRLLLVDEPREPKDNLSIESATLRPERTHVGAGSRLTAVVRNRSDRPQQAELSLFEGDLAGQRRTVALEPGETAHVDLVHRFESPVDSPVRFELADDALPGDNRWHLPMRMKDRLQALLVAPADDETETGEVGVRGVDLLSYALNPGEALGQGAGTYVSVRRVTPQVLERMSLPLYPLIILNGVTDLSQQSSRDLEAFVTNGGGVWIVPERDASPVRFNDAFGLLLGGLQLGPQEELDRPAPLGRNEALLAHPLLLPLVRGEWGDVRDVSWNELFGATLPKATDGAAGRSSARAALATGDGDPLAAVVERGRGRVFVQLFTLDLDAATLPRSAAFVPWVQHVAAWLASSGESPRPETLRVGEILQVDLPEFRSLGGRVEVASTASTRASFPLGGPDGAAARIAGLRVAGAYSVTHPGKPSGRQRWVTVNPVAGESDLAPINDDELARLFGKTNARRVTWDGLPDQFSRRRELTGWLIGLLFVAFLVEAAFGAWQSRRGAREERE